MVSFHRKAVVATMAAKRFAHAHLLQRNVVIMTSLDVRGDF